MKAFAAMSVAAVAAIALSTSVRQAEANSGDSTATGAAHEPIVCDVHGLTPGRARNARPARHQILWNAVDSAELVRDATTLELKLEGAGGVLRGEVAYALTEVQLRRRTRSRRYPVEARFIHENASGDRVVVGLYFTEGAANPGLEPLRAVAESNDAQALQGVNMRALLPADGALVYAARNDAACAPRVTWTVLTQPIEASAEQLQAFAEALPTAGSRRRSGSPAD